MNVLGWDCRHLAITKNKIKTNITIIINICQVSNKIFICFVKIYKLHNHLGIKIHDIKIINGPLIIKTALNSSGNKNGRKMKKYLYIGYVHKKLNKRI